MTNPVPLVSIGMPVFNGERYLSHAIESILAQDFRDFELIISDNASTDATRTICQEYAARDPRIRYHRMPQNVGAAANYNQVFAMSQGEYFKWAAHDDILLAGFLSACLAEFERHKKDPNPPSVVHSKSAVIDESGAVCREDSIIHVTDSRAAIRVFRLLPRLGANAVFGLIRRDALERTRLIGSFLASDMVLLVELVSIGPILQVDDILFHRRVHVGMSTLANRDRQSLLSWFDPNAKQWLSRQQKLFLEYQRSTWRLAGLDLSDRLLLSAGLCVVVPFRRLRVIQGAFRRKVWKRLKLA